jgi:hypothetical protein
MRGDFGLERAVAVSEDWIRHEGAATAAFEIVKRMDLAGQLEIVAVDGIVPALDIDAAFEAMTAKLADDVGPIRVAETRMPVMRDRVWAMDAVLVDNVPINRGVFAVNVEDFGHPSAQLR